MSDVIPNLNPQSSEPASSPQQVQPASDPTTAGHAAQANKTTSKGYDTKTTISSLEDLRKQAPEVFRKMMEGIAMNIISKMRRAQERLEEMWRDSRERK